jgi:hypothetical protein
MNLIWKWLKENPIRTMFLIPILLVTVISISHVVAWYSLSNPISWAIYLSIAIEVAAMTALVAATNRIKGGVWIMFGLVTLVQMIGNIFFSYKEIDSNSDLFKSWVELTSPIWEILGSDVNDVVSLKRWLAFLEGGLLPIISLTSLHFFVKYDELDLENKKVIDEVVEKKNEFEEVESIDEEPVTYGEESVESIESIESEDSVEENVVNEPQDVPDTNVGDITETVENIESISESQQRIIDNANLSNLEYIRKMVGIPEPIVQTPEPEIEKEIVIEEETNDGEISDNKVRLTYTKNS